MSGDIVEDRSLDINLNGKWFKPLDMRYNSGLEIKPVLKSDNRKLPKGNKPAIRLNDLLLSKPVQKKPRKIKRKPLEEQIKAIKYGPSNKVPKPRWSRNSRLSGGLFNPNAKSLPSARYLQSTFKAETNHKVDSIYQKVLGQNKKRIPETLIIRRVSGRTKRIRYGFIGDIKRDKYFKYSCALLINYN